MSLIVVNQLKSIINQLPINISYGFAYGSAVFMQGKAVPVHKNMIDFIFAVDNPEQWHKENMARNPSHYSLLRVGGPKLITNIQHHFGAKIYFNTLVPCGEDIIKYGVIQTKDLINDLLDWETLYVSGRLHKPVQVLMEPQGDFADALTKAIKINRSNALHAALLLLPETFTEEQLYYTIAKLSYAGDFRMIFGEDKNKVENIVNPHLLRFRNLYNPYIESDFMKNLLQWNPVSKMYIQETTPRVTFHHLNMLPKNVQEHLYFAWNKKGKLRDLDDVLHSMSQSWECKDYVYKVIEGIVWRSSWSQSFMGFFSAGLLKSIKYSSKKIRKMYKSMGVIKS